MSVAGTLNVVVSPYHDELHGDGLARTEAFKMALTKLGQRQSEVSWSYGEDPAPADDGWKDKPGRLEFGVEVKDNVNFWFQLVMLPRLLTPYFWNKTDAEMEAARDALNANGAWATENWKKLALAVNGSVAVIESYDCYGGKEFKYMFAPREWNESGEAVEANVYTAEGGVLPDHAAALERQIKNNEALIASLKARPAMHGKKIKSVAPNKTPYWGMWK